MKLLVIGKARHGKDTFAEILAENFEFSFSSSSMAAAKIFLFDVLKQKYGYKTLQECYDDRLNKRDEWFDLITAYNIPDRNRLTREILKEHTCYAGMRNLEEFKHSKDLFDLVVYVDATERVGSEDSSMQIDKKYADIVIENNGTLEEFEHKILRFGKLHFKKKFK